MGQVTDREYKGLLNQMQEIEKEIKSGFAGVNERLNDFQLAHQQHEFRISVIEKSRADQAIERKEHEKSLQKRMAMTISVVLGIIAIVELFLHLYKNIEL